MPHQKPNLADLASEVAGQSVVLADGEELGVVEGVISAPPHSAAQNPEHYLVVYVEQPLSVTHTPEATRLFIEDDRIHTVTADTVVLGTTAPWLTHHASTQPPT
jgi:hypothetical protein